MSCADTCLWMGDYESGEFYRESNPRAAKRHQCCECRRVIEVGERHQLVAGKADGSFWTFRSCAECAEIGEAFCCEGRGFEMLWETIREQMFPGWDEMKAIDCLARLKTDAAIAKMRAEYAKFRVVQDV